MLSKSFKDDELKYLDSITNQDRNLLQQLDAHVRVFFNY